MPRIVRTPLATKDLHDLGHYIARESHSLETAERYLDWIADKCALYATEPELGELSPDLGAEVRRFTAGNYVVFYFPIDNGIEILRVLHGSRDTRTAWKSP